MRSFRKVFIILAILAGFSLSHQTFAQPSSLQLYGVPATYKVFQNEKPREYWLRGEISISAAKNEYESFQVILRNTEATAIEDIQIQRTALRSPGGAVIEASNYNSYQVEYIQLEDNPKNLSPPSIQPLPGRFPDPLWPLDPESDKVKVDANTNQPLWFVIYIPPTVSSGNYTGEIIFTSAGTSQKFTVNLKVYDFSLPDKPSLKSMFNLGDFLDYNAPLVLRGYHGISIGGLESIQRQQLEEVIDLYYQNFKNHRLSPFLYAPAFRQMGWAVPEFGLNQETDEVWINFSKFDPKARQYLNEDGFLVFTVPGIGWNLWGDCIQPCEQKTGDGSYTLHFPDEAEKTRWRKHAREYFRKIGDHLRDNGWIDRAYLYMIDEVKPWQIPFVKELATIVKEEAPELKRTLTYTRITHEWCHSFCTSKPERHQWCSMYQPTQVCLNSPDSAGEKLDEYGFAEQYLNGYVDVWIPEIRVEEYLRQNNFQRPPGTFWLYEFLTQRIDLKGITNRLFPWFAWHDDAQGILYYGTNYWGVDRWNEPRIKAGQLPGWGNTVNGNGFYFYPPCQPGSGETREYVHTTIDPNIKITHHFCKQFTKRIVPSIRWELLREGMEDYEYLHLLNQLGQDNPEAQELLNQAKNLINSHDEFEKNPQVYLALRQKVATKIEAFSGKLPGDANQDGRVDSEDFALLVKDYLGKPVHNTDFNSDGRVDSEDFAILQANYLKN